MHHIQRQYIEFDLSTTEVESVAWQRRISDFCEHTLQAEIEHIFNSYNLENQNIVINKLSLDIKDIKAESFEQDFIQALRTTLSDELRKHRLQDEEVRGFGKQVDSAGRSGQQLIFREWVLLLHFLEFGSGLWFSNSFSAMMEKRDLLSFFSEQSSEQQNELIKLLERSLDARLRLALQFVRKDVLNFLKHLDNTHFKKTEIIVDYIKSGLKNIENPLIAKVENNLLIWQVDTIITKKDIFSIDCSVEKIINKDISTMDTFMEKIISGSNVDDKDDTITNAKNIVEELLKKLVLNEEKEMGRKEMETIQQKSQYPFEDNQDYFFIHNAGLVLLHPFLSQFLRTCNAADEDVIKDESYAIALLEYLASGRIGVSEDELTLNKLLCGVLLEKPIACIREIAETHQNEAENLLKTVIEYWSALGNTSSEGLQQSFLWRDGKLSKKENGDWLLQIEQKSYDMLLDELPWGYSIIKLPFMENAIWVE